MKIIDYFHSDRKEHWREQIARYEWRAARFLAQLLAEGRFHSTLGSGTLYLLTEGDKLVSFLTLAEKDCVDAPEYTPWIGFVHTAPEYRGRCHIGRLIDHAVAVAGERGAEQVYICTDHVGLYEKYGFTYLENRVSIYGEDSRVYLRKCRRKGRVVFLNGVTSSGKTSIVEALQDRTDAYFYVVANDLFQEMVGERFLRENYWEHLSRVVLLMYHTARLYADMGHDVLIDGILVEQPEIRPHYRKFMDIMGDSRVDVVEVYCPLDICRERNIARGDRYEAQSQEQHDIMAEGIRYSCRVETHLHTPEECAEQIMQALGMGQHTAN